MKRVKKALTLTLAFLTVLLLFPAIASPAEAAQSKDMGFVHAVDNNGNVIATTIGVPIMLDGECTVLTEASMAAIVDRVQFYQFSYPGNANGDMVPMNITPDKSSDSITTFHLETSDPGICYEIGVPVANEEYTLFFWETEDGQSFTDNTAPSTITELLGVDNGGLYQLGGTYDGSLDNAWFTMILLNGNTEVVAFYTENGLVSFDEPIGLDGSAPASPEPAPAPAPRNEEDAPARGSDDSGKKDDNKKSLGKFLPIVIILAVVAAAVAAIIAVVTSGKKKSSAASVPPAPVIPQPSAPEEIIPTIPGTPEQAGPVQDPAMFNGWQDVTPAAPQQPRPLCPYVSWVAGPLAGQRYRLTQEVIIIGRSENASIRLPADTQGVSRTHCQIIYRNGSLTIADMGSTSGTFIKDKGRLVPNQPVGLREGDHVYLGSQNVEMMIIVK